GGAGDAVRSSARGGAGAPGCGRTRGLRRGPGRAWGPVAGARGPRRRRHRLRPQGAVAAAEVARTVAGDVTRRHLLVRAHRGDPVHPADVAASVGVERWDVLPEIPAVRSVSGSGG